jgi:hypothetical protein
MQMHRTNPDHHHQEGFPKPSSAYSSPEGELIALARSKGQVLTEPTLRLIRETLELRGVSLAEFVSDARPHFRNNILNPSGFLINRARNFHQLSRPARVPAPQVSVPVAGEICAKCNGQKYILSNRKIEPCGECSSPEFKAECEIREAERAKKLQRDPDLDGELKKVAI